MMGSRVKVMVGCGAEEVCSAFGITLRWLLFLQMVPLAVVMEYDLGADGQGSATPSVLCSSVVTHIFAPGGNSGNGLVWCRLSKFYF